MTSHSIGTSCHVTINLAPSLTGIAQANVANTLDVVIYICWLHSKRRFTWMPASAKIGSEVVGNHRRRMTSGSRELRLMETSSMACTLSYCSYPTSACWLTHAGQSVRFCFMLRGKYCTMQTVWHRLSESSSAGKYGHISVYITVSVIECTIAVSAAQFFVVSLVPFNNRCYWV